MFSLYWNTKERQAIGVSTTLVSIFGIWSIEKDDTILKIRWVISAFSVASIVFQSSYESYVNCVRLENNADNLYSINFGIIGLSKLLFFFIHRRKIRINVDAIVNDCYSEDAKKFNKIMRICRTNCRRFTQYFLTFGLFVTIMYNVKVFFIDPDAMITVKNDYDGYKGNVTTIPKKRFLLPAACGFSDASQVVYWTIVVCQWFTFVVTFGINFFSDLFFTAIAAHLCSQFEILQVKFASLTKMVHFTASQERLNCLIARHSYLLELASNLETAFSMIILVQMVANVFILNVAGFNVLVLLRKKEILGALTNASLLMFSLIQTFMYSYVGEVLTSRGDDIAKSVYICKWYSMPSNLSKNVIFVMARARFPIGLTAGKFFRMNHSTFTDIVKTAASYLSVLRIMIKDDI